MGKKSLNNFISHLSWLKKLSPAHTHPLKTHHEFSKPYVWVIIFWVRVTHKMLNVNWEKIHSIILCHLSWLKKLCPCSYTSPQNHSWIFETLRVIIFWLRVTHKMQPQNKGPGMLWGQSYVLPMTWGGGGIGAPFCKTCSPMAVSLYWPCPGIVVKLWPSG